MWRRRSPLPSALILSRARRPMVHWRVGMAWILCTHPLPSQLEHLLPQQVHRRTPILCSPLIRPTLEDLMGLFR